MNLFLAQPDEPGRLRLEAEEAHHCLRVLRHAAGDEIHCVDGLGHYFRARIAEARKDTALLEILETAENWGEPSLATGLAVSLLKSRDRFEWLLEKAMELGITHIYPTLCERTERSAWKAERERKVLVAGLKQTLRSRLPLLAEPAPIGAVLRSAEVKALFPQRFFPHCLGGTLPPLPGFSEGIRSQATFFCIGPEGDFAPAELELARAEGFTEVSLGQTRLRAETAAMYALAAVKAYRGC